MLWQVSTNYLTISNGESVIFGGDTIGHDIFARSRLKRKRQTGLAAFVRGLQAEL